MILIGITITWVSQVKDSLIIVIINRTKIWIVKMEIINNWIQTLGNNNQHICMVIILNFSNNQLIKYKTTILYNKIKITSK